VPLLWGGLAALHRIRDPALVAPLTIARTAALQLHPRPDFLQFMPLLSLEWDVAPRVRGVQGLRALLAAVKAGAARPTYEEGAALAAAWRAAPPPIAVPRDAAGTDLAGGGSAYPGLATLFAERCRPVLAASSFAAHEARR
jgi:hypothetical protein